jgi:hypothetical protein
MTSLGALLFFACAVAAVLAPRLAIPAMLGSVIVAYAVAAVRAARQQPAAPASR